MQNIETDVIIIVAGAAVSSAQNGLSVVVFE
jgi:hypothetical protein